MKNRNDRRHFTSLRSLVLISAFIIAVAVVAVPFYSVRSSSSPKGGSSQASAPSRAIGNVNKVRSLKFGISPINESYSAPGPMAMAAMLDEESIAVSPPAVRAPGCNTAILCLGETVSAQVVNAPLRADFRERRIQWVAPDGTVPRMWTVDESPETDTYTLETTGAFAQVGTWTVRTINNRGGGVAVATFEVGDPTQASVDLALTMTGPATVAANDTPAYVVTLTNNGPDAATNVVVTNPVPANSTFLSASPAAGFSCNTPAVGEGGAIVCTASSLAVGGSSPVFTFTFTANSDVTGGTSVFDVAQVDSDTNEPFTSNNIAYVGSNSAESGAGEGPCTLDCRDDVVVTADTTQGGESGKFVSYSAAAGNGNCGAISNSPGSGSFFSVTGSPHTVTSSSTEGPSCTFTITVLSSTAPTISCPASITVTAASGQDTATLPSGPGSPTHTASGGGETVVGVRSDGTPATYDDNGNVLTPAVVIPLTDPYPLGTTGILWTVTDAAGRTSSCSQGITVQATARTPLTISCPANVTATAPSGNCQATVTVGNPTTNPSDSQVTVRGVRSDGESMYDCDVNGANCTRKTTDLPFPAGVTLVVWTATDDVNDSVASCTQSVTVTGTDTGAPTLQIPDNISVTTSSCSATLDDELFVATADDNCTESVNVGRTGVPANFVFPTGTTVITYTATDASGNTATGTQLVTVYESTPPTINAPASILTGLNTGGVGGASCGTVVGDATLGTATANDNCPGVTVTRTGVPAGNDFPVGDTIVTYTATDRSGNTAHATQTIRVVDNTPPIVTAPGLVTINTGAGATSCGVTVSNLDATLGTGSATDNCTGLGAVTRSGVPAGNVFPVGDTVVTYSATDAHGNTSSANQTVRVVDNTPPTISCPADITLEATCPSGAIATYAAPVVGDNCGVQGTSAVTSPTAGLASGSVFPIGTTTVTNTVTDIHGNSSSCSFTVTVLTPQAIVQNLMTSVTNSSLTGTQKNGLLAKLNAALGAINDGKQNVACNKLSDFVNSVGTLISHGDLTALQGNAWISSANHVRNTIGCTNDPCT